MSEKSYFYYERNEENVPIITVCLKFNSEGIAARGLAFINPSDGTPRKKVGRQIAEGRATKALKHKTYSEAINFDRKGIDKGDIRIQAFFKSWYNAQPLPDTPEEKIFRLAKEARS